MIVVLADFSIAWALEACWSCHFHACIFCHLICPMMEVCCCRLKESTEKHGESPVCIPYFCLTSNAGEDAKRVTSLFLTVTWHTSSMMLAFSNASPAGRHDSSPEIFQSTDEAIGSQERCQLVRFPRCHAGFCMQWFETSPKDTSMQIHPLSENSISKIACGIGVSIRKYTQHDWKFTISVHIHRVTSMLVLLLEIQRYLLSELEDPSAQWEMRTVENTNFLSQIANGVFKYESSKHTSAEWDVQYCLINTQPVNLRKSNRRHTFAFAGICKFRTTIDPHKNLGVWYGLQKKAKHTTPIVELTWCVAIALAYGRYEVDTSKED